MVTTRTEPKKTNEIHFRRAHISHVTLRWLVAWMLHIRLTVVRICSPTFLSR